MNRLSKSKKCLSIVMAVMLVGMCMGSISTAGKEKSKSKFSKEEIVYVITDGDGNKKGNKKTIVENYISNPAGEKIVQDRSMLDSITPLSGINDYDKKGDKIRWDTRKMDICYRGETDKTLPLKLNVEYYLDGEKLSADEIKGRSGEFKMRISFDVDDNKLIKKNTLGIVGLGFKGANFSNIEGDNLKVLDKDKDKFAVGYMSIGKSNISALNGIANSVEIRGETKNFKPVEGYAAAGAMSGILKKDGIRKTLSKELNKIAGDSSITAVSNTAKTMVEAASRERILLQSLRIDGKAPKVEDTMKLLKAIYEKSGTIPKTSRQIEDYMQRELIPITRSSVERFRKASEIFEKTLALKPVENAAGSEFADSISALKAAGMDREINALKANFKSHYGVDATVIGGTQIQQALIGIKKISDGMASIGATYGPKVEAIHKQNAGINQVLYKMTYGMKKAEAGLETMDEGYKKIAVAEKILFAIGSRYHMGASLMAKTYPKFAEGLNKYGEGTTKFNAAAEKLSQGGSKLADGASLLYSKAYADFGTKMRTMVFEKLSMLKDKKEQSDEGFSGNRKNTTIDTKYVFKFS